MQSSAEDAIHPKLLTYLGSGLFAALVLVLVEIPTALPTNYSFVSLTHSGNLVFLIAAYLAFGLVAAALIAIIRPIVHGKKTFVVPVGLCLTVMAVPVIVYQFNLFLYAIYNLKPVCTEAIVADAAGLLLLIMFAFRWRTKGVGSVGWFWFSVAALAITLFISSMIVSQVHLQFRKDAPNTPLAHDIVQEAQYPIPPVDAAVDGPNVLLICVDTLRADALGCYGNELPSSPATDKLAASGVVFKNTVAQSSWTLPSVASFLTGIFPYKTGATKFWNPLADSTTTIAEIFDAAGYETGGFIANPFLSKDFQFDAGFDHYDYKLVAGDLGRRLTGAALLRYLGLWETEHYFQIATADMVVDRFLSWIEERADVPVMAYLHFIDPHNPYMPPKHSISEVYPDLTEEDFYRLGTLIDAPAFYPSQAGDLKMLYLGEVRFFDEQLERLLDAYHEKVKRPTLVVLWSDHGEAFGEHGQFEHGKTVFIEETHVPFILSMPGVLPEGKVIDEPVAMMDLLPTLCSLIHIPVPSWTDGIDLTPVIMSDIPVPARPIFSEMDYFWPEKYTAFSVQIRYQKVIFDFTNKWKAGFDLIADPIEKSPLSVDAVPEMSALSVLMEQHLRSIEQGGIQSGPVQVDEDTLERLKALGYLQ